MNEAIRVAVISLGCARNLVDSEVLLGHVAGEGLQITLEPEDADVVVVNTCGFVEDAKRESIETILETCQLKDGGQLKGVVAVGCLAERYAADLARDIPELDAVLGISDYSGIPGVVRRIVNGSERRFVSTVDGGQPKAARSDLGRLLLTPRSYSYLRISEGCDHKCSFCAIPTMRGRNRSKPIDVLVEEATAIGGQGVRELVVVAEDSTAYGMDSDRRRRLPELLERLAAVDGIEWLRLMYAYPHTVDAELTRVLRENPVVLPYLDIPVQHISSPMLQAMRRGVSSEQVREVLSRLRDDVPGIAIRSTLISGFPGETDADHAELRDHVAEFEFERLGVFSFSREQSTPAYDLPGQVDVAVAEARRDELMEIQRGINSARNRALVGQRLPVLVDGLAPDRDDCYVARTTADAPEVDCLVELPGADLHSGDLVEVEITGVAGYDLVAEVDTPSRH